jgi:ABC-type sugar transport system ATPase subunit
MRNGQVIRTAPVQNETVETLVSAMLGKPMAQMYPARRLPAPDAPVVFEARDLHSDILANISLSVRHGEIVGLAGLVGSGRSRLARTLFGAEPILGGEMLIEGKPAQIRSIRDAMRAGIYLLPESRKEQGLLLKQSIQHNVSLPHLDEVTTPGGVIRGGYETGRVGGMIRTLNVQPGIPRNKVNSLSGGNQQKVLFGKWLFKQPRLFIVDEPTRGIDVGAKQAIYELIAQLAERGMAILLISSEIEEILGLAHRVLVMREGQIVAELSGQDGKLSEEDIMHAAFGTV